MQYKLINFCEFDKYPSTSYCAIHGVDASKNLGDITKVKVLPECDLLTYGFPCQDISVAGKQAGIEVGTRSGLLYEVERLIREADHKPKFLIMENVKNLIGKKFKADFDVWLKKLEDYGYVNYYQVLNAKNYNIPQNRERVFCISIRKDIDNGYEFPIKEDLQIRLKDILEKEVDEKYYLSDWQVSRIKASNYNTSATRIQEKEYCDTLCAKDYKDPKCVQVGILCDEKYEKMIDQSRRVYSGEGICPTICTMGGGNLEPKVMIPQATAKGYIEMTIPGVFDATYPNSLTRRGRVQEEGQVVPTLCASNSELLYVELIMEDQNYINNISNKYDFVKTRCQEMINKNGNLPEMFNPYHQAKINEIAPTQTAQCGSSSKSSAVLMKETNFRIRKLTPLECWRLMGFGDEDFYKAQAAGISNSQLYKQAGNSIVVNVLEKIYEQLITYYPNDFKYLRVISLFSGVGAFEKALDRVVISEHEHLNILAPVKKQYGFNQVRRSVVVNA